MEQVFNPYLPSYEYVPDGEPHVFDGRLYLYGSHDRFGGAGFCLNDYVCWSADVHNLKDWHYEGVIFRKDQDPVNQNIPEDAPAQKLWPGIEPKKPEDLNPRGVHAMWAPDVVHGKDGRYYLYYCMDFLPEIRVAVCDTPAGKYEYLGMVQHADRTPLGQREGDFVQFDPGIFIDDDGEIYLYSGNAPMTKEYTMPGHGSQVMTLCNDMLTLKTEPRKLMPDIHESEGTGFEGHELFEASSIRKINGIYYFVYSSVLSHELCYAISDRPDCGYVYGGTLVSIGDIGLNGRTKEETLNPLGNTHGGIECADGKWYVFYHRQTNRTNFSRQGCAEEIHFDEKGHISQAEVTSCGLNGGPLKGHGCYPAYICCQLTAENGTVFSGPFDMTDDYPFLTQDENDLDAGESDIPAEPVQYIKNMRNGSVAGYKYFDFEKNLSKKIKITVRGKANGSILVMADSPDKEKGYCCGRIITSVEDSSEWSDIEGEFFIPAGIHSLYFVSECDGSYDLRSFEFK